MDDPHPMQHIVLDPNGVPRFRGNVLVMYLVEWCRERGMGLNELATMEFPAADWCQLAQLIGYSVSGFGDLSYADPQVVAQAGAEAAALRRV